MDGRRESNDSRHDLLSPVRGPIMAGKGKRVAKPAVFVNRAGTVSLQPGAVMQWPIRIPWQKPSELPPFRRSIIPRALTWKRLRQPSSRASALLSGYFITFNTHNKCTGVCRFVRGVPVGIGRRIAALWGFCGAGAPRLRGRSAQAPGCSTRWVPVITSRVTQGYRTVSQSGGNSVPDLGGRRAHG